MFSTAKNKPKETFAPTKRSEREMLSEHSTAKKFFVHEQRKFFLDVRRGGRGGKSFFNKAK